MSALMPTQMPPSAEVAPLAADLESPVAPYGAAATAAPRGGAHVHGSFSIEKFCDQGALSLTHEDAAGWRNYLAQWHASNFWYADAGVKVWAYYEDYDNWQDTYGMDAVLAAYHSGHGGMDANGVFYAPMGADWGGLGCTALSSKMRLGNEYARYIFWSTCLSLRVLGGHNPIRTWQAANLGLRMIFGFETVSWDDANYGKFFWEEWNKNKSLSTAWLDASWRIAHDQAPSVAACGATQQEAQDRLFNERNLQWGRSSTAWWWWRWYNAAAASREPNRNLPREMRAAELRPLAADAIEPARLADRFGFTGRGLAARPDGSFLLRAGERHIARDSQGGISVRLTAPNYDNRTPLALGRARQLAEDTISRFGLDADRSLVFDRALHAAAAGGSTEGSGTLEPAYATETVFQFRQTINGLPVITPGGGTVRVGVDNDGKITEVQSSLREVQALSSMARVMPPHPPESVRTQEPMPEAPNPTDDVDALLAPLVGERLRDIVSRGGRVVGITTVPGTTEIGYDVRGDVAELVARKGIEVDFGGGYRKRYWVRAPIFG